MKKDDQVKSLNPQELAEKNAELTAKVAELTNNWKRALADYQNLDKRVKEERQEWAKLSARDLILKLLPAVDVLLKASAHTNDQGVELALKEFFQALESEGLVKFETVGKTFDPQTMECIDVAAGDEDNRVIEELRAGYLLYGKVIRPAQVKVSKKQINEKAEKLAKEELIKGNYM